ncbi:DUF4153 domain-containing protein [Lawsonibacter faecis]|uniref:DUF4173 domain-containing protein n=1 Tax=Lawsonibacter faecis TaxID=2763052 RepID=A0A8J6MC46_9FIRM|nr:DUF4173 domain-containing protein [Lawsonibacter faecis]MBC5736461.1 DUF4173 domain-containing protein [Lawsonibacter faecis]
MSMEELHRAAVTPGADTSPACQPKAAAPAPRVYETDGKERGLLPLALLLSLLLVEMVISVFSCGPGLVVPALVAAWYAVLLWYRGAEGLLKRESLLLFCAVCLLALTFALFSNDWFRGVNLLALPVLLMVQTHQWSGAARRPWYLPTMLWERFLLTVDGLFCRLGASWKAASTVKGEGKKRGIYLLLGLGAAVLLLLVTVPMLLSADALFAHLAGGAVDFFSRHMGAWVGRLLAALCLAPFLFGLLYSVRRPEPLAEKKERGKLFAFDAIAPVTVLVVMDALYLFFIAVQFAALFGGERYLAVTGISHAEYARSGFFQLVGVAGLNLTLVMACLQICRREGKGFTAVRALSTVLVASSFVMLGSAACRMTLYVTEYGLSFKRALTYWGMLMLAVFFTAALLKIWKKSFSFFKVLFAAGLAGWLALNFINVDRIVTRYNVSLYQQNQDAVMDLPYLAFQSYDTLDILEELPGDMRVYHYWEGTLEELIAQRRDRAAADAADWRSWSVSAQLAAIGGRK